VDAPRISKDAGGFALMAITEVRRLRKHRLSEALASFAEVNKQLLRDGVAHINGDHELNNIFPTIKLTICSTAGILGTVQEQLLFVTSVELPDNFELDYYLNSRGELLAYKRDGDVVVSRVKASDMAYINHAADALLAIEIRTDEAMDPQPSLPPLRLV